ncbi:MAG: hypothetical protein RL266_1737 [Bacteroidota bacterium]|jgi:putative hemolysin
MGIPMPSVAANDQQTERFIESFIDASRIKIQVSESELNRVPAAGGCVILSNRLFGPADAILVIHALSSVRKDIVVLTSYNFSAYPELQENISFLNIEESEETILHAFQSLLKEDKMVVLFPAHQGTISRITANIALDKRWHPKLLKVIYQLSEPIIPVYLRTESVLSLVHSKTFSFDRMTSFFKDISAEDKNVQIRFGRPIADDVKLRFSRSDNFGRYVRARLYALGSPLEVNAFFSTTQNSESRVNRQQIGAAIDPEVIAKELSELPSQNRLLSQGVFDVFIASAQTVPMALKEIGRQREITFRAVGEGTGQAFDLDEYDMYYHQLILWDRDARKIAGGYRLGFGHEIMELYGKRGFYLHSLFKFKQPFHSILEQSIELGRSYVTPEYQKARLPLFLLWKGILTVLLQNLGYRYLLGPVSISNEYSSFSRQLIVAFIKKYYWNSDLAQHVKPRKAFRPLKRDLDIEVIVNQLGHEITEIDKVIEEVEPKHFKLPVLIKKYIKQEAKIIGFNVDPSFSNVLDGLILLDMMDIPLETLEKLNHHLN